MVEEGTSYARAGDTEGREVEGEDMFGARGSERAEEDQVMVVEAMLLFRERSRRSKARGRLELGRCIMNDDGMSSSHAIDKLSRSYFGTVVLLCAIICMGARGDRDLGLSRRNYAFRLLLQCSFFISSLGCPACRRWSRGRNLCQDAHCFVVQTLFSSAGEETTRRSCARRQ